MFPETIRLGGKTFASAWIAQVLLCASLTFVLAFAIRLLEWPMWQNPEYRLGNEMLLATHDAYHWVAGASGFGRAASHPMAEIPRLIASWTGWLIPNIAFWLPAVAASLVAALTCLWCGLFGALVCGIGAGLMASIAPGFLGRTLLGYYDTDIVTLLFPLLMAFAPAWFIRNRLLAKQAGAAPGLSAFWAATLTLAGLMCHVMADWHSVFPYLIRCNGLLLFLFGLLGVGQKLRWPVLLGGAAYILPALGGWPAFIAVGAVIFLPASLGKKIVLATPACVIALWVVAALLAVQGDIFLMILNQLNAYFKNKVDVHSSGGVDLVFPSVAQSIIEVQDLAFFNLFPYFHPWLEASLAGVCGYLILLWKRPEALFLAPLLALGLASSRLGGRMVMFGAPIAAIGVAFILYWLSRWLLRKARLPGFSQLIALIAILAFFVGPFLHIVPALSQGPILNRRHAAALSQLKKITPENAMIWLWWDWGYAAQYFGRRQTICDGAQHGGPSLYLPAAVFATDSPRFARQIICRTAGVGNEPGNFFKGMADVQAQALLNSLRSGLTPLVAARSPQYLVVSFEMLKLGFWISYYGSWNFISKKGESGAISIVPQALDYNLRLGEVRLEGKGTPIFPISINIFEETGLVKRNYLQEWVDSHPGANEIQRLAWLSGRRNVNFLFNRVTDEKLALGEGLYESLMASLLLCDPGDLRFTPYFKLVYDNVFTRVYQVLGTGEENSRAAP